MAIVTAFLLASVLGSAALLGLATTFGVAVNILYVALGLGLVIFFHELGHFAVAKWCNVHVDRFSIGFGPILWRFKIGETEYALSAIPFGGYVKMLGQDDMDPSQLSTEEIAQDPRAYSAKSVPQRMAIISAGVIMNVLTAVLFFGAAFGLGVRTPPAIVGEVQAGMPAWVAGLQTGDRITRINDREVTSFGDIMRTVAVSSGEVRIEGRRADGTEYRTVIAPDEQGPRRMIGVGRARDVRLVRPNEENIPPVFPGTPAASASPAFQPGDLIRSVGETEIISHAQLQDVLARRRAETLDIHVEREGVEGLVAVTVEPNPVRTLGLWMDIGKITAVKNGSPADEAGIRIGDKITRIDDLAVGTDLNPLELPDYLWSQHGEEVVVTVSRPVTGGGSQEVLLRLVPADKPGWIEHPTDENVPLSVPSMGVAFPVIPTVLKVEEGSPAEQAGIRPGERIRKVELTRPQEDLVDGYPEDTLEIEFGGRKESNWAFAFWVMQAAPTRQVTLTVGDADKPRALPVQPQADPEGDWFAPTRGLWLELEAVTLKADGILSALQMGGMDARNTLVDIYLTLRNLLSGRLSITNLHGPIGIAQVAYTVADTGIAELLLFLGFLSVNLAVINFLPIPVLDGGHMVFLCWEAVTRKKPSERVLVAATYAGMLFILGLMLLVLYLDIFVHRGRIL